MTDNPGIKWELIPQGSIPQRSKSEYHKIVEGFLESHMDYALIHIYDRANKSDWLIKTALEMTCKKPEFEGKVKFHYFLGHYFLERLK